MAKRPLASWVEPMSLPLTYSPVLASWKVRPRSVAIARPTRVTSARSSRESRSAGARIPPSGKRSGMAHVDQRLLAALHRVRHVAAEPGAGERCAAARDQLAVEPGRAVAADLGLEIKRREGADGKSVAAPAEVVAHPTLGDVGGDAPLVGVEPLDMAGPAQRLQAADMGADESLGVAADALDLFARPLQMRARTVDACLAGHVGDVQISRPRMGNRRRHLDDHAPPNVLDAGRISELKMMDPAVHAIDDQIDPLAHLIAGQSLAEDTADNRLGGPAAVGDILADAAFLGEVVIGQRPVHGLDDVDPLAKLFQGRLGLAGDNPASRLRLGGETVVFQTLRPADHKVPVLADEVGASFSRPQIDDALIALLGDQHFVEPGQALSIHFARELAGDFDLLWWSTRIMRRLLR